MTNNNPPNTQISGHSFDTIILDELEPPPRPTLYIVSGTHKEFQAYVDRKYYNYANQFGTLDWFPHYIYVSSIDVLRGLGKKYKGFFVGSWRNRRDIKDIEYIIEINKARYP